VVKDLLAIEPFGRIAVQVSKLAPYALIIGLFTFIYIYIPNTRVRWGAALGGALVGGIAWQTAGWAFASFVAQSASYTAIYSGFAILIFFMIWIYLSWLIVLIGASVSFYIQHGEYVVASPGEPALSARLREQLALLVMQQIAQRHAAGTPPLSLPDLARQLSVPAYAARQVLDVMTDSGMLTPTRAEPPAWLPLRDLSTISAWQIVEAVRTDGEKQSLDVSQLPLPDALQRLIADQERALAESMRGVSLRSLADDAASPGFKVPSGG